MKKICIASHEYVHPYVSRHRKTRACTCCVCREIVPLRPCARSEFLLQVSDNGRGIDMANFPKLCRKYTTSKLAEFADLSTLTSFGFRGEALSSLCGLGELKVTTRTKAEEVVIMSDVFVRALCFASLSFSRMFHVRHYVSVYQGVGVRTSHRP